MIIRYQKKINKIVNYSIQIPIDNNYKLLSKIGTFYSKGENIAYGHIGQESVIHLPNELTKFDFKKDKHGLKVSEGEIVIQGDIVFKKEKLFGSAYEEVISNFDGVVRLDQFENGLIKIIGEKKDKFISSPFSGVTTAISPTEFLNMDIECLGVKCFQIINSTNVEANVFRMKSFENVNVNDIQGKLVYTLMSINIADYEKLLALGAVGVITHYFSLERQTDLDRIKKKLLVIIDGFGSGKIEALPNFDHAIIDVSISSIIFQNIEVKSSLEEKEFDELNIDDYVRILRSDLYGQEAQVIEIGSSSAKVEIGMMAIDIPYIFLLKLS